MLSESKKKSTETTKNREKKWAKFLLIKWLHFLTGSTYFLVTSGEIRFFCARSTMVNGFKLNEAVFFLFLFSICNNFSKFWSFFVIVVAFNSFLHSHTSGTQILGVWYPFLHYYFIQVLLPFTKIINTEVVIEISLSHYFIIAMHWWSFIFW